MFGLKFRIEALYFTNFRKSTSTSLINTYSIPPFTTLRGMISNALGLKRDDLRVQDWIKIGVKPQNNINLSTEMTKVLKLKGTGKQYQKMFPSAPIFKEFLVNPIYDIYIAGEEEIIQNIRDALKNPKRPLYIGASDELVDLTVFESVEIEKKHFNEVYGVVDGIHEDCIIEKIPYKFSRQVEIFLLNTKQYQFQKMEKSVKK
jgi:CRISPR-associated protein Cas5, N-terminal domain